MAREEEEEEVDEEVGLAEKLGARAADDLGCLDGDGGPATMVGVWTEDAWSGARREGCGFVEAVLSLVEVEGEGASGRWAILRCACPAIEEEDGDGEGSRDAMADDDMAVMGSRCATTLVRGEQKTSGLSECSLFGRALVPLGQAYTFPSGSTILRCLSERTARS